MSQPLVIKKTSLLPVITGLGRRHPTHPQEKKILNESQFYIGPEPPKMYIKIRTSIHEYKLKINSEFTTFVIS